MTDEELASYRSEHERIQRRAVQLEQERDAALNLLRAIRDTAALGIGPYARAVKRKIDSSGLLDPALQEKA